MRKNVFLVLLISFFSISSNADGLVASAAKSQSSSSKQATQFSKGMISANHVNIRSGPSLEKDIIGQVPTRGSLVQIVGKQKGWYQIVWQSYNGWVHHRYVVPEKDNRTLPAMSGLKNTGPNAVNPTARLQTDPEQPAAIQSPEILPEYHYQESLEDLPPEPNYGNLSLSLKEAVVTALNKNFDIQIEKLTPKISETGIGVEKGIFDPSFTASVVNSRTLQENVSNDQTVEDKLKGTAGISKRFTPGTKLAMSYETTDNDDPGTDGRYNSGLKLVLTQNLLKNFGTDINTAKVFIAEKEHEQSRKSLLKKVIDVVADVQNAYWDYYLNNKSLEIRQKSYALTKDLFLKKKAEARFGALAPIELVEIESRVATRITEYLEARKLVQESDIKLRTLLDLPFNFENVPVWILPTDRPEDFQKTFDFSQSLQTALNNHPDFQKILLRLAAKERETQYSRNQTLPDLEATASYGIDRYANAWDNSMSVYGAGNNYELGLRLTVPLGNREAKSNYTKTKLELDQIKKEKSRQELEIKRDISKAKIALELSILIYRSSVNDLKLKKKNLHAAEQKLKYGAAGLRQLLDVQTELIEANLKLVETEVAYEKALVEMYKAQGVFDSKFQIDIATLYTQ